MPSETTGLQAYTIECTLRGQSIVMNYNSRNLHMLLGSKAVVFYALFSGRTGGRNAKRSIKRTDLCRRIINIIPEQSWKRRIARKNLRLS